MNHTGTGLQGHHHVALAERVVAGYIDWGYPLAVVAGGGRAKVLPEWSDEMLKNGCRTGQGCSQACWRRLAGASPSGSSGEIKLVLPDFSLESFLHFIRTQFPHCR